MNNIIECVPNFSEGRDKEKIEKIIDVLRNKKDIKILDYSSDKDHNRSVVTLVGTKESLKAHIPEFVKKASDLIDLRNHKGHHPRMGAVDVIPFIPIKNCSMEEAVNLSKDIAKIIYEKYEIPSFLYEKSATSDKRRNLSVLRSGEFEKMEEKIKNQDFKPDFGESIHESFGIVAIGAREYLVAYNVLLSTPDIKIAETISKKIRHIGGGLRYLKAMPVFLEEKGLAQISMNLTNFKKTPMHMVVELIRTQCRRYGISIVETELIGLVPLDAIAESAGWYLQIDDFNSDRILEKKLMDKGEL